MAVHRGQIVEAAVEESGISMTKVAEICHVTRNTLYNWYKEPNLPIEKVILVGKAIRHDFSSEIPELKKYMLPPAQQVELYGVDWRDQYMVLQAKHIELLEKQATRIEQLEKIAEATLASLNETRRKLKLPATIIKT
jgi:lambda repressor-like predicted transcriptional regulator